MYCLTWLDKEQVECHASKPYLKTLANSAYGYRLQWHEVEGALFGRYENENKVMIEYQEEKQN